MESEIFCTGPLLHTVQMSGIFTDSKTYVDRPLLSDPAVVLEEFAKLGVWPNINQIDIRNFVDTYFAAAGADLDQVVPGDFATPDEGGFPFASWIVDPVLRVFAHRVHNKWKELGRMVNKDVILHPDRHTLIALPFPFIVPGGRFRELYYWDSFWIIQGLMVSGMKETAKGMILNFAHLIDKIGLIPNGSRTYYSYRSEPPLFALMVDHYINHKTVTEEERDEFIRQVLPAVDKEHTFWMTARSVMVSWYGKTYTLNRYTGGGLTLPRPESYFEDLTDARTLLAAAEKAQQSHFSFHENIAAAAESGVDFSTRWLDTPDAEFLTIRTQTIIPVDLNAFLYAHEKILSALYRHVGDEEKAQHFDNMALNRGDAIHAVFWNAGAGVWYDFDLKLHRQRETFYLANLAPLYTRCNGHNVTVTDSQFMQQVLQAADVQKVIGYPGGFPCSFSKSSDRHTQWDFPNAWPPLQTMLIEGFLHNPDFREMAVDWAQKWVSAVFTGFSATSHLYEKYDANTAGAYGSGGEYLVQEGFGWTNGTVLRLLELFPGDLSAPDVSEVPVLVDSRRKSVVALVRSPSGSGGMGEVEVAGNLEVAPLSEVATLTDLVSPISTPVSTETRLDTLAAEEDGAKTETVVDGPV
ncbi:trehalase-like [Paramacrobiotus metropolitanus]|uniref:trehalase-like n=1 Tax=Paramacrobiotus metropolitanus TaxID=2943436 RepID=UPI002445CFBF|nr:trehalase-like [Paramacrobiotus metropolitanus]